MKTKKPVNLDLRTMKFPPTAIASILHRISGLVLFLLMPVMLYFLNVSLRDEASYRMLHDMMFDNPYYKFVLWVFSVAIMYHALAGIRHLIMDLGYAEELSCARRSAVLLIALSIVLTFFLGFLIW